MKLQKLKNFGHFDNFRVKRKHIFAETGIYPYKKPTRQRIQLLLHSFGVLIHENVENFTRIALEIQKLLKKSTRLFEK